MSDTMEIIETEKVLKTTDGGDHDKFSHYAEKAKILEAQIEGIPCTALCGKTWIPNSDPEKYPVCPECHDIYENVVGTNLPGGGR